MKTDSSGIITFPCFVAIGKVLLLIRNQKEMLAIKYLGENRYIFRNGASPKMEVHFLIDQTGAYRQVQHIRKHHEWTAFFAHIYDFVTIECEILTGEILTSSQLIQKIKSTCDLRENHFPRARRLVRFLKKLPADKNFDECEFQNFILHK